MGYIEQEETAEYKAFVDKFKPKKTTDDCYTPPLIYEAVKNWACKEYDIDSEKIVRPFYPGGDYEKYEYPAGCVVLDNPPFSILTKIIAFYLERGIAFFLFAPTLTALAGRSVAMRCNHIITGAQVTYENGAKVNTSFVTSFDEDTVAQTAPELRRALEEADRKNRLDITKSVLKYAYPDYVLTAAMLGKFSKYEIEMKVYKKECLLISKLDSQKEAGKSIYGGGLLLSQHKAAEKAAAEKAAAEKAAAEKAAAEKAAAEKAAAEKAAATRWSLSDRERELIASL